VGDRAPRPVVDAGGLLPRLKQAVDQIKQRLEQFRKVRGLRWPLVHLGVDVDCVIATPDRP
jgi:hypothetical protein